MFESNDHHEFQAKRLETSIHDSSAHKIPSPRVFGKAFVFSLIKVFSLSFRGREMAGVGVVG